MFGLFFKGGNLVLIFHGVVFCLFGFTPPLFAQSLIPAFLNPRPFKHVNFFTSFKKQVNLYT